MTDEQLSHLRSIIVARIEAIEASLAKDDPESKPVAPDVAIGRLSRLESMQAQQMNLAQQRRQREGRERLQIANAELENELSRLNRAAPSVVEIESPRNPQAMEEARAQADEQIVELLDAEQREVFKTLRENSAFGNFTIIAR